MLFILDVFDWWIIVYLAAPDESISTNSGMQSPCYLKNVSRNLGLQLLFINNLITSGMGLYYYISSLLTGIGYGLLAYKSSFVLSLNQQAKVSLLQPLGMKWVVFILFLIFEPTLEAVLDIVPFGLLGLLTIKCMIVLPQNTLATYIYKRIERQLAKVQFQEYPSKMTKYTSKICKFVAVLCIKGSKTLAVYVKTDQLGQVYTNLQQTLHALEYKRTAVGVRQELGVSTFRRQMSSDNDLNQTVNSVEQEHLAEEEVKKSDLRQSQVMIRMSQIVLKPHKSGAIYETQVKVMTVKPNKEKNIKSQYRDGQVVFDSGTSQITFRHSGLQLVETLRQVKYVTKNMMVLELVMDNGNSTVIKFIKEQDVLTWMKPVLDSLKPKG